ncbi:MAG: DUF4058 family protein [Planctomycetes bacterium]|nr:DUF4058 family protein [Planctomycetota bacterium]
MSVHDWTRAPAGTFHHFHTAWIVELGNALNGGILPTEYYALVEQKAGEVGPDVLTLHSPFPAGGPRTGGRGLTALAEAPPRVSITAVADEASAYALKRRTLAIRHASGHDVVALVEILSPGNKNTGRHLDRFLHKACSALLSGLHLLVVDLFPPGKHDPEGIHGAIWMNVAGGLHQQPEGLPLTLASYSGEPVLRAYVEPVAVGATLPDMPLFLEPDGYVGVPLEETYRTAFRGLPGVWRTVLEDGAVFPTEAAEDALPRD